VIAACSSGVLAPILVPGCAIPVHEVGGGGGGGGAGGGEPGTRVIISRRFDAHVSVLSALFRFPFLRVCRLAASKNAINSSRVKRSLFGATHSIASSTNLKFVAGSRSQPTINDDFISFDLL
jgi:hypothetical protein